VIFFAGLSWRLIVPALLLGVVGIAAIVFSGDRICAGVSWPGCATTRRPACARCSTPPRTRSARVSTSCRADRHRLRRAHRQGFHAGTQTHLEFIPERTTDFIFAALSEEFGLAGVLAVIGGFVFLIFRGLWIAAEAPTVFTRLLAGAISLTLFTYAFVNMGMVSGILPVVGVPLPFISYGGTAMVTLGLALGILMSVARSRRLMHS
jgi:rod shape determining protein RodA